MKFKLTALGQLSNTITTSTFVINESWLPSVTDASVLINGEIIQIEIHPGQAILVKRSQYNTTIRTHSANSWVYLLEVESDLPPTYESGLINSSLYPVIEEDVVESGISVSGVDYIENIYTYGTLVSRSYPIEGNLSDTTQSNISINIKALPVVEIADESANIGYSIVNAELIDVVKRGYNEDESANIGYSIVNAELIDVVKSINYTDGSGVHATLTSGSMATTAIDTTYTDGSGVHATLTSGSLS